MRFFLAVFILIIATSAQATVGPMVFSPAAPNSNNSFVVTVTTGPCEAFSGTAPTEVQVAGNVINITQLGISNSDFILCFFPRSMASFTVGAVPAGSYSVNLYLRQLEFPTLVDLVQTGSINVIQGENILKPVPSNSLFGLLFLLFLLFFTGFVSIRRI